MHREERRIALGRKKAASHRSAPGRFAAGSSANGKLRPVGESLPVQLPVVVIRPEPQRQSTRCTRRRLYAPSRRLNRGAGVNINGAVRNCRLSAIRPTLDTPSLSTSYWRSSRVPQHLSAGVRIRTERQGRFRGECDNACWWNGPFRRKVKPSKQPPRRCAIVNKCSRWNGNPSSACSKSPRS